MSVQVDAVFDNIAALTDFANSTIPNTIWQSFTSGSNQYLYGVQLYGKTPDTIISGQPVSAVGVNITIYNGTGTGGSVFASLTSATVAATGPTWVPFVFPSPFTTLTIGNVYTIAIGGAGSEDFLWGYSYNTPQSTYPGGTASFAPPSDLFFKVEIIPVPVDPNIPNTFNFVEVQDGSAAAPSYTFSNELTTGMYRPGGGIVGFTSGGTASVEIDSLGVYPDVANTTVSLGDSARRYNGLYLNTAGHNTFFETASDIPIIRASGADPTFTYTLQGGIVIRIGTTTLISGLIYWNGGVVGGAGNLYIESTVAGEPMLIGLINLIVDGLTYPAGASIIGQVVTGLGAIRINLMANVTGSAPVPLTVAMLPAAGSISFSGTFPQLPNGGA